MYRNDTVIPFFALLLSVALYLATYLDGQHIAQLHGGKPPHAALSEGQIGLVAFATLSLIYALIGYFSAWLEGVELRPGRHVPSPGMAVTLVALILAVVEAALGGFFVRLLLYHLTEKPVTSAAEGTVFGLMMLVGAVLLAIYKKYYLGDEVLVEEEHSEVPW